MIGLLFIFMEEDWSCVWYEEKKLICRECLKFLYLVWFDCLKE